jgi:hypothetical protein
VTISFGRDRNVDSGTTLVILERLVAPLLIYGFIYDAIESFMNKEKSEIALDFPKRVKLIHTTSFEMN